MRILFLCDEIPWFNGRTGSGSTLIASRLLAYLATTHQVTLVTLSDGEVDEGALTHIRRWNIHVVAGPRNRADGSRLGRIARVAGLNPTEIRAARSAGLISALRMALSLDSYDVAYLHYATTAQYLPLLKDIPIVVNAIDSFAQLRRQLAENEPAPWRRLYLRADTLRWQRFERRMYGMAEKCIVVSPWDRDILLKRCGANVEVVPNGVDTDYYCPGGGPVEESSMVFTGVMNYPTNTDAVVYFCKAVLPAIKSAVSRAKLYVVGREPTREVRALYSPGYIEIVGTVDDIRPHVAKAAVYVAPLRIGTGIKNKVLEAMAMEKAIVGSPLSFRGINVIHGEEVVMAQDPHDFAAQVSRLLSDKGRREKMGERARMLVQAHHAWPAVLKRYEEVLQAVAGGRLAPLPVQAPIC